MFEDDEWGFEDVAVGLRGEPESEIRTVDDPPLMLIWLMVAELAVCAILLMFSVKWLNGVGYVIGAVVVAVTAVTYRSIDRARSRSPRYRIVPWAGPATGAAIAIGILLSVCHAYFWYQEQLLQ